MGLTYATTRQRRGVGIVVRVSVGLLAIPGASRLHIEAASSIWRPSARGRTPLDKISEFGQNLGTPKLYTENG